VNYEYNLSLNNFRYVSQHYVPKDWQNLAKYDNSGVCSYPRYKGVMQTKTQYTTNLCGIASLLMSFSLVSTDPNTAVPYSDFDRAIRLVELAKRYKQFDSGYNLGDFAALAKIKDLAKGTSSLKGELTNWSNCNSKIGVGVVEHVYYPKNTTTSRQNAKDFIKSHLSANRPVIAIISMSGKSNENANNANYIKETGGYGHLVVIVGVTYKETTNDYRIRFKDPWANNQTFEISYTKFLNSMVSYPLNYNLLAIGSY
jgi:hypothetical protein